VKCALLQDEVLGDGQDLLDLFYLHGVHRAALATLRRLCKKINVDRDKYYPASGYESEAALAYNIAAVFAFYRKVRIRPYTRHKLIIGGSLAL
jgi:hypothetical protein